MFQYFLATLFFLKYTNNNSMKKNAITGFLFGLCLLVRFNAIVFLLFLLLFDLLINVIYHFKFKVGNYQLPLFKKYSTIATFAFLTLFIGTPVAWRTPLRWLQGAIKYQFNQENNIRTIFNGEILLSANTNYDYLLNWFLVKTPIPFILLFLLSTYIYFKNKSDQKIIYFFPVLYCYNVYFFYYLQTCYLRWNKTLFIFISIYSFVLN